MWQYRRTGMSSKKEEEEWKQKYKNLSTRDTTDVEYKVCDCSGHTGTVTEGLKNNFEAIPGKKQ